MPSNSPSKLLLMGVLSLVMNTQVIGQCANNNTFHSNLTPLFAGDTATAPCIFAGEYISTNVIAGNIYVFTSCGQSGFDTQLTLRNATGTVWYAFNDNFCSQQSQITWTATYTGVIRLLVDEAPSCAHDTICQIIHVTQVCQADAGTSLLLKNGNSTSQPVYLCEGTDTVDVLSNNDYQLPVADSGEIAELMYMVCNCPITSANPLTDTCFSGQFITDKNFTGTNPGLLNTGNTYYLLPVTVDDGDNGSNPNGQVNVDNNGDKCYAFGTSIELIYLNPLAFASNINCTNESVDVSVFGGKSEIDSSNYTITNTGAGYITGLPISHGGTISINGLKNGDMFSFDVLDINGCFSTFSGGPSIVPNAGDDSLIHVCVTDTAFSLDSVIKGDHDSAGIWYNPLNSLSTPIFTPGISPPGIWKYVVDGGLICDDDTSFINVFIDSSYTAGKDSSTMVCQYDSAVNLWTLLSPNVDTSGFWIDPGNAIFGGVTGKLSSYLPVGNYKYLINSTTSCSIDTSVHKILMKKFPFPGGDSSLSLCDISGIFVLSNGLSGPVDVGGIWTDPTYNAHTGSFNPLTDPPGNYSYTLNGQYPCTDTTSIVNISVSASSNPGIGGSHSYCRLDSAIDIASLLSGSPDNNGFWLDPNLDTLQSTLILPSIAISGNYSYTITGINPCSDTSAILSLSFIDEPKPGLDDSTSYCTNDAPSLLFNAINGQVDAGGSWQDPLMNTFSGNFNPSIHQSGVYTYTVNGQSPCADSSSYHYINVVSAPNPGGDTSLSFCNSDSLSDFFALIPHSPDTSGVWKDPMNNTFQMPFNPAAHLSGTYTYIVSGTVPCSDSSSAVVVAVETAPNAGQNGVLAVCSKDSAVNLINVLQGNPDLGGTWKDSSNLNFSGTFIPSIHSSNIFTYTVSGINPCSDSTAEVSVQVSPAPNPGLNGTLSACSNDSILPLFNALNGIPDSNGYWKTPQGLAHSGFLMPSTDPVGNYKYIIPGQGTCQDSSSMVSVSVSTAPNPGSGGSFSYCTNDNSTSLFQLLGNGPDSNGFWRAPTSLIHGTTFNPALHSGGIYAYTILGQGTCKDSSSYLSISTVPYPNGGTNGSVNVCESDSAFNMFSAIGGFPDTTGIWRNYLGNTVSGLFNPATDTSSYFTYTVSGTNPCSDSTSNVQVNVFKNANAGRDTSIIFCDNMTPISLFNLIPGNPDSMGTWLNSFNTTFNGVFNPNLDTGGIHTYTVNGTPPCGNVSSFININVNTLYNAGLDASLVLCENDPPFNFFNALNGNPDIYGNWKDPRDSLFDGMSSSITLISGIYTYTIPANAPCPADSAEIDLTINSRPNAGMGHSFGICESDLPVALFDFLSDNPDSTGWWLDPSGSYFGGIFSPTSDLSGIYKYIVSGEIPCPDDTSFVRPELAELPYAGKDSSFTVCWNNERIILNDYLDKRAHAGGYWIYPDQSIRNGFFDPHVDESGNYFYVLPNSAYCSGDTMKASIKLSKPFNISVGPDIILVLGDSKLLNASSFDAVSFEWTPEEGLSNSHIASPTVKAEYSTTYVVNALNHNNCLSSDTINVTVVPNLYIPNTFTPNGDGRNDYWYVEGLMEYPGASLYVVNKLGHEVYRQIERDERWDGTYKGEPIPDGIYLYFIEFEDQVRFNNRSGVVNIMR